MSPFIKLINLVTGAAKVAPCYLLYSQVLAPRGLAAASTSCKTHCSLIQQESALFLLLCYL